MRPNSVGPKMQLSDTRCPLCGGEKLRSHEVLASDVTEGDKRFTILECTDCRLAWQWPLLRQQKDSIEFFDEAYKGTGEHSSPYFSAERKEKIAALELEFANYVAPAKGKLLDIGCGNGTFVAKAARNGWHAVGIDPAAPRDSVPGVHRGDLTCLGSEQYDVITMWDVIEHLDDPTALLTSVQEYMKPGGLLIIETGNYLSTDRVYMGKNWWCYQYDHRWYFSPHNLQIFAENLGFEWISLSNRVLRPDWGGNALYNGPSMTRFLAKLFIRPVSSSYTIEQYKRLREISRSFGTTAGLHIFACVVRKT